MKRKILLALLILFLTNPSFAGTWGYSLQENSYNYITFLDAGFIFSPFSPYILLNYAVDKNMVIWGGIHDSLRFGGNLKLYPNLALGIEHRNNQNYFEILVPFLLEKLKGGVQLNIGALGNSDVNLEGAFSYPINNYVTVGGYFLFPFKEAGKVLIFGRYYFKDFYITLALDGNSFSLSILKYLKFKK
ncbi:MAG: hypothetical protein CBR30_00885 [Dictyoglomus sp. NZ13-RE01]|nr:MAG: hypothetical protein CBR30_00885 [Dictyoglomus sp. NZ13-RE01]